MVTHSAEFDAHPDRLHGSGPEPFGACPDGGRCWHGCPLVEGGHEGKGLPCWRVNNAAPLSGYGETWTPEDRAQHRVIPPDKGQA